MLQPRKRKFTLKIVPKGLLLCIIILLTFTQNLDFAKGEDVKNGLIIDKVKRGERVIRHGDVNIVVLDEFDRRKITPSFGLLSTTARTFIQEGTTTEYATHVYGTTLGDRYAHIVSTGSKIFYDRASKGKNTPDPIITLPSLDTLLIYPTGGEDNDIVPSKVAHDKRRSEKLLSPLEKQPAPVTLNHEESMGNKNSKSLKPNIPSIAEETPVTVSAPPVTIKPAKVKQKNELPTFTVRQDSFEMGSNANQIKRSEFEVDNIARAHVKASELMTITTTYFGFADFVTTAGNTVIVFTPKTMRPAIYGTSVTTILGEPTLNTKRIQSTRTATEVAQTTTVLPVTTTTEEEINVSEESTETGGEEITEEAITTEKEMVPKSADQARFITIPQSDLDTTSESTDSTTTEAALTELTTKNVIVLTTNPVNLVKNVTNIVPLAKSNDTETSSPPTTPSQQFQTFVTTFFLPAKTDITTTPFQVSNNDTSTTHEDSLSEATTHPSTEVLVEEEEVTTREISTEKEEETVPTPTEPSKSEEEVELIFKTLYTTYTYLTTYFQGSSTSVKSREEVVTNVVTSTLDNAFLQMATTDPAVAKLFTDDRESKVFPTKPEDNEILQSSMEVEGSELKKATPSLQLPAARLSESSGKVSVVSTTPVSLIETENSRTRFFNRNNGSRIPFKSVILKHSPTNVYKMTIKRLKPSSVSPSVVERTEPADSIVSEAISVDSVIVSAPLVSSKETVDQSPKKLFLSNDSDEDQLSQESNTEELPPSPSLISLQTSYTTYTYFTTIYKSNSSSEIISRLETVTNVNTELVKATSAVENTASVLLDESSAPVTYYTTYTYWTTFYTDGSTKIKTREETVSNIVTPTVPAMASTEPSSSSSFTVLTYYTTSYINDSSVVNSHLETVVNAVPTIEKSSSTEYPVFQPTDLDNVTQITPSIVDTPINSSKEVEGTVSLEEGKVIDALGISTTFYTTKVIGTRIEQLYAQVIESTSSIKVNSKPVVHPSTVVLNDKIYQTGILQLREGSVVKQHTTTFYTTKIVGSVVDNEYTSLTETQMSVRVAQITPTVTEIKATSVVDLATSVQPTRVPTSPTPSVIESSISETTTPDEEEEDNKKSNRHKPFTPVIRPFASRSRLSYTPKKKTGETSSAATITRGITPTIVAIPALKTAESKQFSNRNRFAGGNRRSSSSSNVPASETPTLASASKRFSRTKLTPSSSFSPLSSPVVPSIRPSPSSYKRGSYKPSISAKSFDYLSQSSTGSRFKIRPTAIDRRLPTSSTTSKHEEENVDSITEQIASSSSDEEVIETVLPPTTTENSRKSNPLLRFRKPGTGARSLGSSSSTTTSKPTTGKKPTTSRSFSKSTTTKPTASTSKTPRARATVNYNSGNRVRLKSPDSLFPSRTTSKKPEIEQQPSSTEEGERGLNDEEEEVSEEPAATEKPSTRSLRTTASTVSIKPFSRRGRSKRQAEWGYKYESVRTPTSRHRRPAVSAQNNYPDYYYYDEVAEYTTEDVSPRRNSHSKSRGYSQQIQQSPQPTYQQFYQQTTPLQQAQTPKIRPSNSSPRSQFTLREKSYSSPQTTTVAPQRSNRRTTRKYDSNPVTKRSSVRQRTYTTTTEASLFRNNRKQSSSRGRTTIRSRYKDNDYGANVAYSQPVNDGSITVTHKVPTEATIPIINGKVTEYKQVVTAKASTQVLAPHQYSTVTGKNGLNTLQLVTENTETMQNGVVEVTKFIIQEFPTTSITWTPTTIRGRKTSFSHVVPSTVYEIKPEVSTITPQLNANAPLANLLLSQLLLGNLNIQQTANPLLGMNPLPATPVTEYKTRTTSYITTLTHSTSAVIPITLRGKEIKTTIVDSSTQVITATEYVTDTVVITPSPTVMAVNNPLKTLLLPALLQAQLLNQAQVTNPSNILDENLNDSLQNILDTPSSSSKTDIDDFKKKGKPFDSPVELAETSVVTLYLSGRKPGEFSTVLSTVTLDEEKSATLRKRNVEPVEAYELKPSALPFLSSSLIDKEDDDYGDYLETVIRSGIGEIGGNVVQSNQETESLESIIGDVSNHLSSKSVNTLNHDVDVLNTETLNNPQQSNHFLLKTSAESAPFQRNSLSFLRSYERRSKRETHAPKPVSALTPSSYSLSGRKPDTNGLFIGKKTSEVDATIKKRRLNLERRSSDNYSLTVVDDEGRGRYNLATKVMSNGVEVIVALDKSTLPGSPQLLRVLPTSNIRPITFTPHTVTDHMIMMLPHGLQDVPNPFITKTYLTTYTYLTTVLQNGVTTTSSEEQVISNVLTENIVASTAAEISPDDVHVTLDSSPIMATKVYQTTYNMKSTIQEDGNPPQIVTSQQTVSNTIVAADNVLYLLMPSEPSFNEINTGPSKDSMNEEFTIKPTEQLTMDVQSQHNENSIDIQPTSLPATADITKTYFVTYTYFKTLLENGSTVVKSNVAISSDVVTEKYYSPIKRTKYASNTVKDVKVPMKTAEKAIQILATKTYLTTFTFFTTLLQDKGSASAQTVIRSRTKVMQNLVTETLNPDLLNADYLLSLKSSLKKDSLPITATATLNDGQQLEITAINENSLGTPASVDRVSSSFESVTDEPLDQQNIQTGSTSNNIAENSEALTMNTFNVNKTINNKYLGNYSSATTILHSATVMKNGATLLPGSQVIKFTDPNGNVSIIPVSDPVSKHPDSENNNKLDSKLPMNNLLNFGTLGINGLSALKPVFSAVAGLWQNNVKTNNVKVEPYGRPPINKPYLETNQIELTTNLKPPNRTPIYIPVGSVPEDNEQAGSEYHVEHQYPDVNQRNNPQAATFSKPAALEKPLVSGGGIPISPGQVITANTDVIVGTPSVMGPRPPVRNSNDKSDVPVGMRPPPVGQIIPNYSDEENRVVSTAYKFEDIIKIPPKPLPPGAFLNNGFQVPSNMKQTKIHHKHSHNGHHHDQKVPMSSEVKFSQLPLNAPLSELKGHSKDHGSNAVSVIKYRPPPSVDSSIKLKPPTFGESTIKLKPLQPHQSVENAHGVMPPPLVAPTSLDPLLVDVRPSQVAQVIIPPGGQNAFVVTDDEPGNHHNRGEIINDPIPYPEENVNPGFVGLKVFGPNSNHVESTKLASNTIRLDIPINPYAEDGSMTESHHFVTLNLEGKPVGPGTSVVTSVLKAPEVPIDLNVIKRPNSKYNFTIQPHPYPYQPLEPTHIPAPPSRRPPYIFPQNKPTNEILYQSSTEFDYNTINSDAENEAAPIDYSNGNDGDGLTQETRLKPNSNPTISESSSARPTKDTHRDQSIEYDVPQHWEIMKEKPTKLKPQPSVEFESNTTMRYGPWTSIEVADSPTKEVNKSLVIHDHTTDSENATRKTTSHRHAQDNYVIGLSPPPPPPPQVTTQPTLLKLPRPSNPKIPLSRPPSTKSKPKPTNPPYPFEKPTPSPVPTRPRPSIINKPPPNILYETDPPNVDELMKLKPLNATGKIEPVKKFPFLGNVTKVQPPAKDDISNRPVISSRNDTESKVEKTTESISKWNENGIIMGSKEEFEEHENYETTPILETMNRTKPSSPSNTVFGILNTRHSPATVVIIPTTTSRHTAISMVIDQKEDAGDDRDSGASFTYNRITPSSTQVYSHTATSKSVEEEKISPKVEVTTLTVTYTKTLTSTQMATTGGRIMTKTIVLTETFTTTVIDTVTHTLQPTNVVATVTTTMPPSTKEIYIPVSATKVEPSLSTVAMHNDHIVPEDSDSILVVMTDKKGSPGVVPAGTPSEVRPTGFDVQVPDEANEISPNDILYSGIYTQHSDNECRPECKVTKNEMCQKIDNNMKCVCRPGFARMFPDHPCKPTFTYLMRVPLERQGGDQIRYTDGLADRTSPSHQQLTEAAREGLDRMVMQSNLRDIYHDVVVSGFEPTKEADRAAVVYVVRLSENADETKLQEEVHKTLKANNYSLGGTDVYAAPDMYQSIRAEDFDECNDIKYHDCSENAQCFNLHGTYTCSCKEGFTDMSYNTEFPGRICSADMTGCEMCNYHGTCYYKTEEEPTCECFQWYAGEFCQINLKVTLITLIAIGVLLSILLIICLVMTCNKQKPPEILRAAPKPHVGFRRYRSVQNVPGDKRAIVSVDTSSEGSLERTPPPFVKPRVVRNEPPSAPPPPSMHHGSGEPVQCTERDRSLTVLIPRAKYRPVSSQPSSTLLTMSTFGPEQKLLNYAASRESSRTPEKKMSRCSMHSRKLSNSTNLSTDLLPPRKKSSAPTRPSSGALVSAGFEVSATVRRTQELDEAYVCPSHNDMNQPTYNSIRTAESSIILDVPSLPVFESSLEDFMSRVDKLGTVSEARSYDETTIHPPVRSLHHIFHSRTYTCDSRHSSSHKDENHTMGERDLGSTYMPKSQLYKPDHRESDGSNFDSL